LDLPIVESKSNNIVKKIRNFMHSIKLSIKNDLGAPGEDYYFWRNRDLERFKKTIYVGLSSSALVGSTVVNGACMIAGLQDNNGNLFFMGLSLGFLTVAGSIYTITGAVLNSNENDVIDNIVYAQHNYRVKNTQKQKIDFFNGFNGTRITNIEEFYSNLNIYDSKTKNKYDSFINKRNILWRGLYLTKHPHLVYDKKTDGYDNHELLTFIEKRKFFLKMIIFQQTLVYIKPLPKKS
jgi:hypothetical protein